MSSFFGDPYRRRRGPIGGEGVQVGCHQNGGDGDGWLDVRPRRKKARRQGDRGQNWQLEEKRFRDWDEDGNRQSRFRDSCDWFYRSEMDYYQDRFVDRYYEESEEERFRYEDRRHDGEARRWETDVTRGKKDVRYRADGRVRTEGRVTVKSINDNVDGSQFCRFVTFYFTNFPPYLSNCYLRKGFEVGGILEEVVIPSRRNVNREVYGFVRFSNVRDVSKLLKVVNSVCYGNFKIVAKVARFDKATVKEV